MTEHLTPAELAAATGKARAASQAAVLAKRGVPFHFSGNSVRVARTVAQAHELLPPPRNGARCCCDGYQGDDMKTLTRDDTEHGAEYVLRAEAEAAIRAEVAAERERLCEALKIAMQHSAWDGVLQLDDALLNIADALLGPTSAPGPAPKCASAAA